MKNQSKSLFPEDVFNLEKRFEQYLELAKLDKTRMSEVQLSETKRAFFGGVGSALMAYINDSYELSEQGAMMAIDSMQQQVMAFFTDEIVKQDSTEPYEQLGSIPLEVLSGEKHAHIFLIVPSHNMQKDRPYFQMEGCSDCLIAALAASMVESQYFKTAVAIALSRVADYEKQKSNVKPSLN